MACPSLRQGDVTTVERVVPSRAVLNAQRDNRSRWVHGTPHTFMPLQGGWRNARSCSRFGDRFDLLGTGRRDVDRLLDPWLPVWQVAGPFPDQMILPRRIPPGDPAAWSGALVTMIDVVLPDGFFPIAVAQLKGSRAGRETMRPTGPLSRSSKEES